MHERMKTILLAAVALGSMIGGTLRGSLAMLQPADAVLPWATLFANVTGSLLIGLYAALTAPGGRLNHGPTLRHFAISGFCGGYTTFSVFSLETLLLLKAGHVAAALASIALSIVLCAVAVMAGHALGRRKPVVNAPR